MRSAEAAQVLSASVPERQRERLRTEILDLRSLAAVAVTARALRAALGPVPRIVHNAGTLRPPRHRSLTIDGIEETLQIHAVAPALLSTLLQGDSGRPARSVFVTSRLHRGTSPADLPFAARQRRYRPGRAYRTAKFLQLALALEWERRRGRAGLHADAVCPGFVPSTAATTAPPAARLLLAGIRHWPGGAAIATSPATAATAILRLAERPPTASGGAYVEVGAAGTPSLLLTDAVTTAVWDWIHTAIDPFASG
ncbi:hypothetical protein GCM10011512_28920 [Tersicoccus solisilvae]|uniref:Short-chain dehydrogenase n=1 Tax=Tersicoccus solisilvae TaxID=1882339 RepID=A0ABQ1PP45_9MICC|nr:hypothetical protein [Tersicoccus solisilvae]GGD00302.1 hypothetical protein GCM10011512_28920 [Tersicoccus solisilvae]